MNRIVIILILVVLAVLLCLMAAAWFAPESVQQLRLH